MGMPQHPAAPTGATARAIAEFGLDLPGVAAPFPAAMRLKILVLCAALLLPAPALGQDAAAFHAEVEKAYAFKRSSLKGAGLEAQSARLDAFWAWVAADKAVRLPLLRAELQRPNASEFFRFDGAELLTELSRTPEDLALGLSLLRTISPDGIQPSGWLVALNRYTAAGLDTRPMAWRWVGWEDPTVPVDLNMGAFRPSPLEALVWSLFGLDERTVAADLIVRLDKAKKDREIGLLAEALWMTATPEGHAALERYAADGMRRKKARAYARDLLRHGPDAMTVLSADAARPAADLRAARLTVLRDPWRRGAFAEYHRLTDLLVAAEGLVHK